MCVGTEGGISIPEVLENEYMLRGGLELSHAPSGKLLGPSLCTDVHSHSHTAGRKRTTVPCQ